MRAVLPLTGRGGAWRSCLGTHGHGRRLTACSAADVTRLALVRQPDLDGATAFGAGDSSWPRRSVLVSDEGEVVTERPDRHGSPPFIDIFRITKTARRWQCDGRPTRYEEASGPRGR